MTEVPLLDQHTSEVQSTVDTDSEQYRLGGRSPLKTLFALLAGPLLSQLTQSIYGIVDSLWISKTHGNFGLNVTSSIYLFDELIFSCGEFMLISISSRVAFLFGKDLKNEASQVVVDLFRFAFIFGLIIAGTLLPFVPMVTKWISGSDDVAREAFKYEIPLLGFSFIQIIFLLGTGILQGEGRSWLAGMFQILSLCMIMFVFDPLFLVYFKMGVWGASLATVIAQTIVATIIFIYIFSGKFSLKFHFQLFFNKPSPHSYDALKVGCGAFMLYLSSAIPGFVMQKYITLTAAAINEVTPVLALLDTFNRLYELGISITYAFDASFLPSASYAYGKRQYRRIHKLAGHTLWISVVPSMIYSAIVSAIPKKIASFWSTDERYLYWAQQLFPIGYLTLCTWPISSTFLTYLESTDYPLRATISSVITSITPLPLISTIIYFSKRNNLKLLFTSYIWQNIAQVLLAIPFVLGPFLSIYKTKDGDAIQGHEAHSDSDIYNSIQSISDPEVPHQTA